MKLIQLFVLSVFAFSFVGCGPDYTYEEDYAYEEDYPMDAYEMPQEEMEMLREMEAEDPEAYAEVMAYQNASRQQVVRNEKSTFKPLNYRMQGYKGGNANDNFKNDVHGSNNPDFSNINDFSDRSNGNIKWVELKNPQTGQTNKYVPLPADWRVTPNSWSSPGGSEVAVYNGQPISGNVQSVDQLIEQKIKPLIQQSGGRYERTLDLPGIAQADQQELDGYAKYGDLRNVLHAKGVEITEISTGNKGIMVIHFMRSLSNYGAQARYWMHILGTKGSVATYNKDKQALIYALSNFKMNAQAVAGFNRSMSNDLAQKDAAFQRGQAEKWNHFNRIQDINRSTSNSVSDTYHDMYKNVSGMRDAGQKKAVDAIWEQSPYTNPYNGQTMNMSNKYQYYYVNQAGQTIGTNNPNFNPAQNPQMNQHNWRLMSSGN